MIGGLIIRRIEFNWYHSQEDGPTYSHYDIGENGVDRIEAHFPEFQGDRLWYSVIFYNNSEVQILNINRVFWFDPNYEEKDEAESD